MSDVYVRVVGKTDTGRVRSNNEDAFVIADLDGTTLLGNDGAARCVDAGGRGVLLAVSDGIGGQRAGEVASAIVVESVTRALATRPIDAPADHRLEEAVEKAHATVLAAARRPDRANMGATLTAVYVHDDTAYVAEIGDSRAYVIRAGRITQLTKDQTYVQILLDAGALDPAHAEVSPLRNVIVQSMGQPHDVTVALGRLALRRRDCIILCSDGLTHATSDDDILKIVLASPTLEAACDALVNVANQRGGHDNVTVIVAGVGGKLPAPAPSDDIEDTYEILKSFDGRVGDYVT